MFNKWFDEENGLNLSDALALAWIFLAVLATGLLILDVNRFSIAASVVSVSLALSWWGITNLLKRRTVRRLQLMSEKINHTLNQ
ncbi:MAG: hypothetical protein ACOYL5_20250 [Phototrophicaceae bacterium]|jgi:hypothetical protein